MKYLIVTTIFTLFVFQLNFSQNYKFGKVSKEELEEKYYAKDSSANAAILYKKRSTYTTVSTNAIQLVTDHHYRIKIYNKDGFDWATKIVNLYQGSSDNENLSGLKAYTYNLEGGEIIETKLNKKDVFTEKKSEYLTVKKFTMPNLKEGSVIEWSYRVYSPFFTRIDDAIVQYEIPVKKQEIKISLLEWFKFSKRSRGYFLFKVNESSKYNANFDTNDKLIEISTDYVPAIKEEPYVNNIDNYTAALQFEVVALTAPRLQLYKTYATSWEKVCKNIYESTSFGGQLDKASYFKDDLADVVSTSTPVPEKIVKVFQHVKGKIKWNNFYGKYTNVGVRKAYKDGVGNAAEINLTLVSMLREVGLPANPVLVSTRSHGIPIFPTSDGFNYVIAAVELENNIKLLDATEKYSLPNVLPTRDLNWQGRLVRENGTSIPINLFPTQHSKKAVFLYAKIDDEGLVSGTERVSYSKLSALNYRNNYNSFSDEEVISKLEKDYNIEINNFKVSNKNELGKPVTQLFQYESENLADVVGGKIYIDPLLFLTEDENPFKLQERNYPVDFGTPWEDKVSVTIEIPEGYKVESLPEQMAIGLQDKLGTFKFITSQRNNKILVMSSTKIDAPIISSLHYNSLKEFYSQLINKQKEKIVLTKI